MNYKEYKQERKAIRRKAIKMQNSTSGKLPMSDEMRIASKETATK